MMNNNAYQSLMNSQEKKASARIGSNSVSALQVRKSTGTAPERATGMSEYMTAAKLAYNQNTKIPVV